MDNSTRFTSLEDNEINLLINEKDSKETKRVVSKSIKIFKDYLKYLKVDDTFENLSADDLDSKLRLFYANARQKSGDFYKLSTIHSLKYGLTKYIKAKMNFDISKDSQFKASNEAFKAVCVNLKKIGFGETTHKIAISKSDMKTMMESKNFSSENPESLQNKIFFYIMYFFCRRGRKNLGEWKSKLFKSAVMGLVAVTYTKIKMKWIKITGPIMNLIRPRKGEFMNGKKIKVIVQ